MTQQSSGAAGTGVPQPGGLQALGQDILYRPQKKNVSAVETANTPISVSFQDIVTRVFQTRTGVW